MEEIVVDDVPVIGKCMEDVERPEKDIVYVSDAESECSVNSFVAEIDENEIINVLAQGVWRIAKWCKEVDTPYFCGDRVPKLSLGKYVANIVAYINEMEDHQKSHFDKLCVGNISPGMVSLVMGVLYINRVLDKHSNVKLCELNAHRMLIVSMTIATKNWRDKPIPNRFMARVGGIPLRQLNQFEIDFLKMLDFKVAVTEDEFVQVLSALLPKI